MGRQEEMGRAAGGDGWGGRRRWVGRQEEMGEAAGDVWGGRRRWVGRQEEMAGAARAAWTEPVSSVLCHGPVLGVTRAVDWVGPLP